MKYRSPTSSSTSRSVSPGRAKHLERNRIAANKCREKNRRERKQFERRLTDETQKKDILLAQLYRLRGVRRLEHLTFSNTPRAKPRTNHQLARMAQAVLQGSSNMDSDPSLSVRSWPSFSTGMWSDESVADDVNSIGPGAYNNDSTALPAMSNDFALYEPYNYTDSIFDSFIGVNRFT
ncbi:hypothetical protein NUH16_003433 [Penicillium rubens]|nr:hypothetical protein NUH16_003433 [Penicillium rubens]